MSESLENITESLYEDSMVDVLSVRFMRLLNNQSHEPLFTYINPDNKRVYGTVRKGVADVYTSNILNASYTQPYIEILDENVNVKLANGYSCVGNKIRLKVA